jgi:signal transduction histidine kinase
MDKKEEEIVPLLSADYMSGHTASQSVSPLEFSMPMLTASAVVARRKAEQAERERAIAYGQRLQLNELKDQFLLNVSHELRTPLTVLGIGLEVLKEQYEYLDQRERVEVLTLAIDNYEALVSLVNRVLDAVAVAEEFSPEKLEVIPAYQIVQEVLARLDPRDTQAYTFRLHVPEQIKVWADPRLLHQVLRDLLSNVFKYVPAQTEIYIEVAQPTPSSPVTLSVQDAGPGIPPEELPLLFEKFVRLKRDLGGTKRGVGLGLYICRQLVEAMGGQIWVESSNCMGEGSRFCLILLSSPPTSLSQADS